MFYHIYFLYDGQDGKQVIYASVWMNIFMERFLLDWFDSIFTLLLVHPMNSHVLSFEQVWTWFWSQFIFQTLNVIYGIKDNFQIRFLSRSRNEISQRTKFHINWFGHYLFLFFNGAIGNFFGDFQDFGLSWVNCGFANHFWTSRIVE